jgi:uncharacterized protein (TIGR03546 family)
MLASIVRLVRSFGQTFTRADSPRWVALGAALGMWIGLLPKGNLCVVVLSVVLLASRANLLAAGVSTAVFSWVGTWTDRVAHRIGLALLTPAWLKPLWVQLFDLPLVPWTRLNNTVVLGSLVLGLVLFYPVYRLSKLGLARYRDRIVEKLQKYRAAKMLAGAEKLMRWRMP